MSQASSLVLFLQKFLRKRQLSLTKYKHLFVTTVRFYIVFTIDTKLGVIKVDFSNGISILLTTLQSTARKSVLQSLYYRPRHAQIKPDFVIDAISKYFTFVYSRVNLLIIQ